MRWMCLTLQEGPAYTISIKIATAYLLQYLFIERTFGRTLSLQGTKPIAAMMQKNKKNYYYTYYFFVISRLCKDNTSVYIVLISIV